MASNTSSKARLCGIVVRGCLLGLLLAFAILKLITLSSGATLFRYQGF